MRVPSSLRAGVHLCGAVVDVDPEVPLHEEQKNTTDGQITLTGELIFIIYSFDTEEFNKIKTSNYYMKHE